MKLRENKIILFASRHTQTAVRADYSTAALSVSPMSSWMDRPTKLPAPPRTPGAVRTWRRAAPFSTKNQFRILKTHDSAPARILSHANGLARSTMSDVFHASTQDCLNDIASEYERISISRP
jgi:hypothetical protein